MDGRGSICDRGKGSLSLFHSVQTGSGVHPTSDLSPGVNHGEPEADNCPPSSAEVKNGGDIPPLPHTFSCLDARLIKHRNKFTVTSSKVKLSLCLVEDHIMKRARTAQSV
jgi:hypothetical protein